MVDTTNFLDFFDIFVNEISGSVLIFLFLSLAAIVLFGSYMRMTNGAIMLICILYMLIMSAFFPFLLSITVIGAAVWMGWQLYKLIRG